MRYEKKIDVGVCYWNTSPKPSWIFVGYYSNKANSKKVYPKSQNISNFYNRISQWWLKLSSFPNDVSEYW